MSDQKKTPVQTPIDWIRYAEGELRVAEREIEADSPVYHAICFLCQGSAEKFLKAYLISKGWELDKIHDIVELLHVSKTYNANLDDLIPKGEILNEYIVASRYPDNTKSSLDFERGEAEEAIEATRVIRMRVMELMAKPNDLSS